MTHVETYFARSGCDNYVKIDRSSCSTSRVASLNTVVPQGVELLFFVVGDYEHVLHNYLWKSRVNGEWFHNDTDVQEVLDEIRSGGVLVLERISSQVEKGLTRYGKRLTAKQVSEGYGKKYAVVFGKRYEIVDNVIQFY